MSQRYLISRSYIILINHIFVLSLHRRVYEHWLTLRFGLKRHPCGTHAVEVQTQVPGRGPESNARESATWDFRYRGFTNLMVLLKGDCKEGPCKRCLGTHRT